MAEVKCFVAIKDIDLNLNIETKITKIMNYFTKKKNISMK